MSDLEKLKKAIENAESKTPKEVLEAFIPEGKKVGNFELVDPTFGHGLFLSNIDHPLATGNVDGWTAYDIAIALFAFTRSSKDLAAMVRNDSLETELYSFLDEIPIEDVEKSATILIAHYFGAMKTIVPMENPDGVKGQKKILSDGS